MSAVGGRADGHVGMGRAGLCRADQLIFTVPVDPVAVRRALGIEGLAREHVKIGKLRGDGRFAGPAVRTGPDNAGGCGLTAQTGTAQP